MTPELPEFWLALGAAIVLAAGALARGLASFGVGSGPRRWDRLILGTRLAAAIALAVALGLGLAAQAVGMLPAPWQVALGLALAALLVQLALWWRYGYDGAGPISDLVATGLVALGLVANWPAGRVLTCAQCAIPYQVQGFLVVAGSGGATVMGATGLLLALRASLVRRVEDLELPGELALHDFMKGATIVTLVVLAAGLLVAAWWVWLTLGGPVSNDPRSGWIAVTWLLAVTSWLAWRLGEGGERWAAVLAVLTAVAANWGALAVL
jgi:hypothetical protein